MSADARLVPSPEAAATTVVSAAAGLVPAVATAADAIEDAGRLPEPLVRAFTETGLFHLFLPASAGGPEVDPLNAMRAIELLATADGSAAWCAHVSSANAWQLATLDPAVVAAMGIGGVPPVRFSGSARPLGVARRVPGGYRVDGRWDFASNCLHAQWYCGNCVLVEEDGRRRSKAVFVPIEQGTIVPTWDVAGLRGTGSHDFELRDVFVPEEHAGAGRWLKAQPGRLFAPRLSMVVNWALTAGVATGIARGALHEFASLAGEGTAGSMDVPLRDRAAVQGAVGRAEAVLGAARAYCSEAIGAVWDRAGAADTAELDRLVPPARLAIVHAMHAAVEVVDLLFAAAGTRAIFRRNGLERRFRDAHVAVLHGAGAPGHFEAGGRLALGLPAAAPFW